MRLALLALVLLAAACGIKGPPRPPLDEPVAPAAPMTGPADAGCCGVSR